MGTGKPRISTAVQPAGRVAQVELALGPVLAELELDPVPAELERVPVEAELPLVPVGVEQALARVVAAPVRGRPRVQRAVALRTKSVTAAHRRGLPRLAVEDLAAVVETTREPAAAEAVIAWGVAE